MRKNTENTHEITNISLYYENDTIRFVSLLSSKGILKVISKESKNKEVDNKIKNRIDY